MLDSEFGESKDMLSNMTSSNKQRRPKQSEYSAFPASPGMTKNYKLS